MVFNECDITIIYNSVANLKMHIYNQTLHRLSALSIYIRQCRYLYDNIIMDIDNRQITICRLFKICVCFVHNPETEAQRSYTQSAQNRLSPCLINIEKTTLQNNFQIKYHLELQSLLTVLQDFNVISSDPTNKKLQCPIHNGTIETFIL